MKLLLKSGILLVVALALAALPAAAQQVKGKSLLWKVSGNGLTAPSYIFGTLHVVCQDDLFLPKGTEAAMASTETLMLELDMDDPTMASKMMQLMVSSDTVGLVRRLTTSQQSSISKFLQANYGVPLQVFDKMKPFAVMTMVMGKYVDCAQPTSYEDVFMTMAGKGKKPVEGLETVEYQISIFDKLSPQQQVDLLVDAVEKHEQYKEEFAAMLKLYKKQDLLKLAKLMNEDLGPMEAIEDELVDERNKAWIPKMEAQMQAGPTFFAVGAAHLPEARGILTLLAQQGYTLTPVK